MTDWMAVAKARGLDLAAEDAERMAKVLAALEERFRPLAADLPPDLEPAAQFRAVEE